MTENKFAWYKELKDTKLAVCGMDGDLPCTKVMNQNGEMLMFEQSAEASNPLQEKVDALAAEVNDFFGPKAKQILEEIRGSDLVSTLPGKDQLQIRMVISNNGIRLVVASCSGEPIVDLEEIIKAGKTAVKAEI